MTSKLYHSATFTVKWSDVDPNKHLRGAVYMDYADHARISFLLENGITNEFLNQLGFGPVLFNANIEYFSATINISSNYICIHFSLLNAKF